MAAVRCAVIVSIASIGIAAAALAQSFDMPQLMAMLGGVDESRAAFTETRYLKALATPIVRRGTLYYVRPDRLEMQIVAPFPETTRIVGMRVIVESADARREWNLASQPVALAWIEAVRASLAGDAGALARLFRTSVSGNAEQWALRLQPVDARVARSLKQIDIHGRRAQPMSIEIEDGEGDRVVIALKPEPERR
jgi:hypothetical protein